MHLFQSFSDRDDEDDDFFREEDLFSVGGVSSPRSSVSRGGFNNKGFLSLSSTRAQKRLLKLFTLSRKKSSSVSKRKTQHLGGGGVHGVKTRQLKCAMMMMMMIFRRRRRRRDIARHLRVVSDRGARARRREPPTALFCGSSSFTSSSSVWWVA